MNPYVAGATEQPEPEYFEVICFGSLAENVAATCHRGSRVVVAGKLEEDTWTGHDGVDRTTQKIIAEGIGLDLRFTTATVARTQRPAPPAEPTPSKPTPVLDELVRPLRPADYSESPF